MHYTSETGATVNTVLFFYSVFLLVCCILLLWKSLQGFLRAQETREGIAVLKRQIRMEEGDISDSEEDNIEQYIAFKTNHRSESTKAESNADSVIVLSKKARQALLNNTKITRKKEVGVFCLRLAQLICSTVAFFSVLSSTFVAQIEGGLGAYNAHGVWSSFEVTDVALSYADFTRMRLAAVLAFIQITHALLISIFRFRALRPPDATWGAGWRAHALQFDFVDSFVQSLEVSGDCFFATVDFISFVLLTNLCTSLSLLPPADFSSSSSTASEQIQVGLCSREGGGRYAPFAAGLFLLLSLSHVYTARPSLVKYMWRYLSLPIIPQPEQDEQR